MAKVHNSFFPIVCKRFTQLFSEFGPVPIRIATKLPQMRKNVSLSLTTGVCCFRSMLEDEDDTHLCLKCRATITGLDNYVRHRKAGCPPPIDREPELRADDFFSSLELQSKKVSDDPYLDLDDDLDDDEDAGVPPRSHTGGKWRPSASSWNILTPPPSFTGGKWRPIIMPPEPEAPVVEPPQPPPQPQPPPTDQEPQVMPTKIKIEL